MIAFVMIVRDALGHGLPKVLLAEWNEAIQTFMFDRPHEALSMRIRVRRPPRVWTTRMPSSLGGCRTSPAPLRVSIAD
jgi:hypothetical protein